MRIADENERRFYEIVSAEQGRIEKAVGGIT
jgi:hypothetical protein